MIVMVINYDVFLKFATIIIDRHADQWALLEITVCDGESILGMMIDQTFLMSGQKMSVIKMVRQPFPMVKDA